MGRVQVICGGNNQIPLLMKVRECGHTVLNTNLYDDSPGFAFADETGVLDVLDCEGNLEFSRAHHAQAIISDQSEISVRTVAYVSEKLSVPSITVDRAIIFTNKPRMRDHLQKNGFIVPAYRECFCIDDALSFLQQHPGKAIIKPAFSHSSRGVFSVESKEDVTRFYNLASQNCIELDSSVIIEEYLEGTEFTVDALVLNGVVHNLAISEKDHYKYNENVANSLYFSYQNPQYDYARLRKLNSEIIASTGIPFGLTHCEYKYCNGEFIMIEMAARGGGAGIAYQIVPFLSGIDNYRIYISEALGECSVTGEEVEETISRHTNRVAALRFIDFNEYGRKVVRIHGINQIVSDDRVLRFNLSFHEGDILSKAENDSNRQGYYIAVGESPEELASVEAFIMNTLNIETTRE